MSEHFTSEQLSDLRTYAAEHRFVDSACAMSLIAEVERLREMLREVANSGVQLEAEPPGLSYATVQIDAELLAKLREEFGQ